MIIKIMERDVQCDSCGWPFDVGDNAYLIDGYSPVFCGQVCANFWYDKSQVVLDRYLIEGK